MKKSYWLPFLGCCLLMLGCSKGARDYTLEEWGALPVEERQAKMKELDGEEATLLMQGAMRHGLPQDTADVKKLTIGELIDEARKAQKPE